MVRTTLMVWIIAGRELTASQCRISGPRAASRPSTSSVFGRYFEDLRNKGAKRRFQTALRRS
jgi:hypothetical protein